MTATLRGQPHELRLVDVELEAVGTQPQLYVLDAGGHAVGQVLRVGRGAEAVHLEIVSIGVEVEIVV